MGRLVGIPHFSSNEAHDEEKEDQAEIRKAKKAILGEEPTDESPEKDRLSLIQVSIAMRMAKRFGDRVLRRTVDSKDSEGKSILHLPPFKTVLGVLRLTDREANIILQLAEDAKEK